jgi:hypothetical protein
MPRQGGKTVRKSSTNKYAKRRRSRRQEVIFQDGLFEPQSTPSG